MPKYENTHAYASFMDEGDPLGHYRDEFLFPEKDGRRQLYFCGNSLGLQPKKAQEALVQLLEQWAGLGVAGHFEAPAPWFTFQEAISENHAEIVGAKPSEVAAMNALTVNLHLLLVTFYRPKGKRNKILYESDAFPSDIYALQSQARLHGLDPDDVLVAISPREGEHIIRTADIVDKIEELDEELALVLFGGVNYYTGQAFDMASITGAAHGVGAVAGYDLAHAAGNIELHLHEWNVDFAAWCTYKYLNAGPGSIGGLFIHQRHAENKELLRLAGWCGHNRERRFLMEASFDPIPTAEGWQISNNNIMSMLLLRESLDIFHRAGMQRIGDKRNRLTGFLVFLIDEINSALPANRHLEVITPSDPTARGAQISMIAHGPGKELHTQLTAHGAVLDWREPNVIRLAPAPLYNSYMDVYRFGELLKKLIV